MRRRNTYDVCFLFQCNIKYRPKYSSNTIHHGAQGGEGYSSYSLMTSALDEGEWLASHPLPRGKDSRYPLYRKLGGLWTQRLEEKSHCLWRGSNPGSPVCSQTLYRLSYPGFFTLNIQDVPKVALPKSQI
jgi:hypothetical protein